jgi:hypothetical protein
MFVLVGGRAEPLLILRSRGAAGAVDTCAVGSCRRLFGCSARKRTRLLSGRVCGGDDDACRERPQGSYCAYIFIVHRSGISMEPDRPGPQKGV